MIAEVAGTLSSYTDSATSPNTTYYYQVTAVNGDVGLEGAPSNEVNVLTDTTPPTVTIDQAVGQADQTSEFPVNQHPCILD